MHGESQKRWRPALLVAGALATAVAVGEVRQATQVAPAPATFAARIAALSEPGGYFDTDNLISNERSYLHVAPQLRALSPQAAKTGVYVGVGPDQNFSYIAQLKPSLAIIVDIRRDNMVLHLLFKALFAEARTRVDYLAYLTGRERPTPDTALDRQPIESIVRTIDAAHHLPAKELSALQSRLINRVLGFGVPLADSDRAKILAFHRRFVADGLSLQFNSTGRAPQYDYPTYRDLVLEVDRQGKRQGFLASEDDFQFVKDLEARDLIIPIVGDLGGGAPPQAGARILNP
jgi:hypothetical protein